MNRRPLPFAAKRLTLHPAATLEILEKIGEAAQLEQVLSRWRQIHGFVFKRPGEVMRDKDAVQAGGHGRVHIGARGVADHPCGTRGTGMPGDERAIHRGVLFRRDLDGLEQISQTGTM